MSDLKNRVGSPVRFARFQDSELWYVCADGFEFPIPLSDTAGATFMPEDKGMFFMRWISKHMKMIDAAKMEAA